MENQQAIKELESLLLLKKEIFSNCYVVTVFDIEKRIEELKNG